MTDVTNLHELGAPVPYVDQNGTSETDRHESLEHAVLDSPDGVVIDDIRKRPYGILLTLTDELRREHPVAGGAHAVLWHTDNDMDDASSGMRLMDKATAAKLVDGSVSAVIADVIEHYKKCPLDDGNPAYRFFRRWLTEQDDDEAPTTA